jgi:HK97 family phage major capsid protein
MTEEELAQKAKELADKVASFEARIAASQKALETVEKQNIALIAGSSSVRSDSIEQKAISLFGVSHVKDLLNVNVNAPRFKHVNDEVKGHVLNLKRDVDIARWMQQLFGGEGHDKGEMEKAGEVARVKGIFDSGYGKMVDLAGRFKAFGSTVVGAGDEWVPTALSSNYIEEYQLERLLVPKFKFMPMPSNPWEMPAQSGTTTARKVAEGAAATDANFNTGKLTFNAEKLVEYYILPEELNEDSAPDILAVGRMEVIEAQHRALETALLNGDTTGTHMDSDVTAASDARKSWMGLRKRALANSTYGSYDFTGGAVTDVKLLALKKLMKKFGVNPRELLLICGSQIYNQLVGLDEVSTVDKFGPMATILNGALAAWRGIPIVVSEYCREDVNDNGVYDGVTSTKSVIQMVNVRRFMFGQRRPIRVRLGMDPRPEYDRQQLVSYQRVAFTGFAQSATEASTVIGIDILT